MPADTGNYTLRLLTPDSTNCNYQISPFLQNFPAGGGSGTINVSVGSGCSWYDESGADWISAISNGGTGPGAVSYTVGPSPLTGPRSTTLVVANQRVTIAQDGTACSFSLSASSATVPLSGATGTVDVTGTAGCTWFAIGAPDWITFASGGTGAGNGTAFTRTPPAPSPAGASRRRKHLDRRPDVHGESRNALCPSHLQDPIRVTSHKARRTGMAYHGNRQQQRLGRSHHRSGYRGRDRSNGADVGLDERAGMGV